MKRIAAYLISLIMLTGVLLSSTACNTVTENDMEPNPPLAAKDTGVPSIMPTEAPIIEPTTEPTTEPTEEPTPPFELNEIEQRILGGELYVLEDGETTIGEDWEGITLDFNGDGVREQLYLDSYSPNNEGNPPMYAVSNAVLRMSGYNGFIYLHNGECEYEGETLTYITRLYLISIDGKTINLLVEEKGNRFDFKEGRVLVYGLKQMTEEAENGEVHSFKKLERRVRGKGITLDEFPIYQDIAEYVQRGYKCYPFPGDEIDLDADGVKEVIGATMVVRNDVGVWKVWLELTVIDSNGNAVTEPDGMETLIYNTGFYCPLKDGRVAMVMYVEIGEEGGVPFNDCIYKNGEFTVEWRYGNDEIYKYDPYDIGYMDRINP